MEKYTPKYESPRCEFIEFKVADIITADGSSMLLMISSDDPESDCDFD